MRKTDFDRFAILLSGICSVHCIALPLIATLMPLFSLQFQHGELWHEFWFHQLILLFILPTSIIALVTGYRAHHLLRPIIIASIGLTILTAISIFAEALISNGLINEYTETLLTIIGGGIHAWGHLLNLLSARQPDRLCKSD